MNNSLDHLSLYHVDGGLIKEELKCDYLLLNCEKASAFFIEIKGSDLEHAVEQITASINFLKKSLISKSINARIVPTRVNTTQLKSIKYRKLEKLISQLKGSLLVQSRVLEEIN